MAAQAESRTKSRAWKKERGFTKFSSPSILFQLVSEDKRVKLIIHAGKNGKLQYLGSSSVSKGAIRGLV